jgi:hypothetical protein
MQALFIIRLTFAQQFRLGNCSFTPNAAQGFKQTGAGTVT